jgi:hypothetical protein
MRIYQHSEFLKARGIAIGPKGGRYYAGSERKDTKGHTKRQYVGNRPAGESRWSPDVREAHDARDKRLPPAGHAMSRVYKGQHVQVTEQAGGGFVVHIDGQHAATGRSLTGALSASLKKPVSGYSFMRLGSAWESAPVRDWASHATTARAMEDDLRGRYGKDAKVAVEHRKGSGMRAHVFSGDEHIIVDADESGKHEGVYKQEGEGRAAKWKAQEIKPLVDEKNQAEIDAERKDPIRYFRGQSKEESPFPGQMIKDKKSGDVRVVTGGITKRYIREDGLSMGLPWDSGWSFSAETRLADEDELKAWNTYEKAKEAKAKAAETLRSIESEIRQLGNKTDERMPSGESFEINRRSWGPADRIVITSDYVWLEPYDGGDYGPSTFRVPYSEEFADKIRSAVAAKDSPVASRPISRKAENEWFMAEAVRKQKESVQAKSAGTIANPEDEWGEAKSFVFRGNTYSSKDSIRAAGGRWDADRKVWTLRNNGVAKKFLRQLQRSGVSIEVVKSLTDTNERVIDLTR